jgi:hypothetical protein
LISFFKDGIERAGVLGRPGSRPQADRKLQPRKLSPHARTEILQLVLEPRQDVLRFFWGRLRHKNDKLIAAVAEETVGFAHDLPEELGELLDDPIPYYVSEAIVLT